MRSTKGEESKWAGRDSNPRRREPTDLQSAPFGRLGTCPLEAESLRSPALPPESWDLQMELAVGLAPTTACLQNRCSTVELRQLVERELHESSFQPRPILGTGTETVKP